jgi:hypothetical protein
MVRRMRALADEKALKRKAARPGSAQLRRDKRTADKTQEQPKQERQFVDIDPWAMLLEQLMELPEEKPAQRKPESGK